MNSYRTIAALLVTLALGGFAGLASATEQTGEQIYREQCASCHGVKGEGTESEYPQELSGDKSLSEVTRLIGKTMPKDSPEDCVGEDADKVARYIYEAFYSPAAQARNHPARIELSRLTVRQYRQAVADLVGGFRATTPWDQTRGLRGEYYNARGIRNDKRVIDRIDPEVDFDFGTAGPAPETFEANQLSIRWQGAVLAPETGAFEFIVRTNHATRLWVNDTNTALIDRWVKSGDDTEFRETVWLLGGRIYPLRLEFSKAKQGVDDSKNQKGPPPQVPAFISLAWQRPKRTAETIPARYLSPGKYPETFVVTTPFPPDDRSVGYERGSSISKAWDSATTDAAIESAKYVAAKLPEFIGGGRRRGGTDTDGETRAKDFCRRFAERAFRRPLTEEQRQLYIDRQFEGHVELETAVQRVVTLVLKSPRFLYRETATSDPFDVASRLSFTLCDSLPDAELLAAAAGQLSTREQILTQARRLANDDRAQSKLREFLLQWLKVEQTPDIAKDSDLFPEFTPEVASDLRSSLELFLDEVLAGEEADFRRLLLADYVYLNGRLAKIYGADLPSDAPFQKVALETERRVGVISHPYLLASLAYTATSSPIHRGVFISRGLLGRTLRPPPEAVSPIPPDLHPGLTTRERVVLQTKNEVCNRCHGMINPLGFTLEHFDAIGRFRQVEKDKPVDATGVYESRSGDSLKFGGARDMATYLASSEESQAAFVEQMFHSLVKQPIRAWGPDASPKLRRAFAERAFNIRELAIEIAVMSVVDAPATSP